jgi:arylformamidase
MDFAAAIDLTLKLRRQMPRYPGDHAPRLRQLQSLERGDALTISELTANCHVGTHADAPAHFLPHGATIDRLARKHFFGEACVVDLTRVEQITEVDLRSVDIPSNCHIILKTRNTGLLKRRSFTSGYCHLSVDAAARLLERAPLSIGIDYYSLDPVSETEFPAHRLVAEAGLPVFVCFDLRKVSAGSYKLAAFGVPFEGAEAMQVRAFLSRCR